MSNADNFDELMQDYHEISGEKVEPERSDIKFTKDLEIVEEYGDNNKLKRKNLSIIKSAADVRHKAPMKNAKGHSRQSSKNATANFGT